MESKEVLTLQAFAETKERYEAEQLGELKPKRGYEFLKRLFDIVFSLLGMVVFAIPMLIIAILVVKDSPGKIIYAQERLGKNEKSFMIYKFRTMRIDAEHEGAQWASVDDERVTDIGRKLRATRMDELPQLLNILKGEMTLVGPRPERPEFYDVFDTYIKGFRQRMYVKPGMTGFAQVVGGYSLKPHEKIVYDLDYIKNRSIKMDFKLIFRTVKVVFQGDPSRSELGEIRSCRVVTDKE